MLQDLYDFDNQETINFFEDSGFYVANRSKSNYIRTVQSVSSTLNLSYLSNSEWLAHENQDDFGAYKYFLTNNLVKNQLETLGYQIFVIPNNFGLTQWEGANVFSKHSFGTPFLWEYLRTTALAHFVYDLPYAAHREQVLDSFELLEDSVDLPGPKFIFAHIISPHPPFVFKEDGSTTQPDRHFNFSDASDLAFPIDYYHSGYLHQLKFINTKIEKTISQILAESKSPPIIIVQGDHGPGSTLNFWDINLNNCHYERMSILNAYHLPDFDYKLLYPEISPVNSFRVIFPTTSVWSMIFCQIKPFFLQEAPWENIRM